MTDMLFRELTRRIAGDVQTDSGTRAAYASDASNHRVVPAGVVFPRTAEDLSTIVGLCRDDGVPITSRGAGTNVAGNAIGPGVVVDYSRYYQRIVSVDPDSRTAVVQPGVVVDRLQEAAAPHGLRFGPDPSTHNRCTIGGMIGTNACGSHSVAWGTTADNVLDLEVVLADGLVRPIADLSGLADRLTGLRDAYLAPIRQELGRFPRQISGYGLQHLLPELGFDLARAFTGSEGTCGIIASATVKLVDVPPRRVLLVAGFADDIAAAAAAPLLSKLGPLTVEGIDENLVRAFDSRPGPHSRPELPRGRAWLMLEAGGADQVEVEEVSHSLARAAQQAGALGTRILTDAPDQNAFWRIRERGAGLATRTASGDEAWPGWEDAAVPPERLADYLTGFHRLLTGHGRQGVVYGHFGEGCVHVRIDHDLLSDRGRSAYRDFQQQAAELVVEHGGSLSGEHGDGRARSELLSLMYGPEVVRAFAAFKHAFDPDRLFNPGVIVDPDPLDANLRLAINRPHTVDLQFGYPGDDGDWGKAMRRCVGVGACRKESGGGMCPSYRATKDERHSTRGRSRLLFEMLDGNLSADGWRSKDVHDALDLCLSCKACSSECPVSVDMATYKAEFLHKHFRRRLRPRSHYSMGWLPLWLVAARRVPRLANLVMKNKLLARLGGIDSRRAVPKLSTAPLKLTQSPAGIPDAPRVTLWVDTFTAAFDPAIADDALTLLRAAGYEVTVVGPDVCCGLTWVSTGQLNIARRVMTRAVTRLAGTPGRIVVLEPSCAAALRGDAPELLHTTAARCRR
ncbi:FAD-binding and (Fe-S)-binding domain-containing protein [Kribbella qitaiheensis]|uniref:FAD-binding and (Fe-S)-binding domain-containing protein n=1 Tax=Kribbella qitaiheensis TaxID=1544730 RepID=UPI0019D560F3|nr:FAD-binding and (Fe-S)-binding domain-containing protein [Kribbella qitaiheensis]